MSQNSTKTVTSRWDWYK